MSGSKKTGSYRVPVRCLLIAFHTRRCARQHRYPTLANRHEYADLYTNAEGREGHLNYDAILMIRLLCSSNCYAMLSTVVI